MFQHGCFIFYRRSPILERDPDGMIERVLPFHVHLQLDSILHFASPPVFFDSLYSRQERLFTPCHDDSQDSPPRVGCTKSVAWIRALSSPYGSMRGFDWAQGACFNTTRSSLQALTIPADGLGWSTWESRFFSSPPTTRAFSSHPPRPRSGASPCFRSPPFTTDALFTPRPSTRANDGQPNHGAFVRDSL